MDDQQRNALAERTYEWVRAVRRLNRSGDKYRNAPVAGRGEMVESLHLLFIALEQISKNLEQLLPSVITPFHGLGERFLTIWSAPIADSGAKAIRLSDARNALEHEAEYIAGIGRLPHLVDGG